MKNFDAEQREIRCDKPFGNVLIVGAGPAAIQVAVDISRGWCDAVGLLNRRGRHSERLRAELEANSYHVTARAQGEKCRHLCGQARVSRFYDDWRAIEDIWQTLILCTPCDSYKEIINALGLNLLREITTVILISPGIGSGLLIDSQIRRLQDRINVISLSAYYAATKFEAERASVAAVFTKALKKRLYIGASKKDRGDVSAVRRFIGSLGVEAVVVGNAFEAESRNITTYVHPPLFINEVSLNEIFSEQPSKKYMYKLYPEGPITQHCIKAMVALWKEISEVVRHFGAQPVNLLKFLNDDNYPVHELSLSRGDIETFPELETVKQEYLLYIRYSSILIDPFSIPDDKGKYFDFSAVPYKQIHRDEAGKWVLPRIPFEDYKKLKFIDGLAGKAKVAVPQTRDLIAVFEKKLGGFVAAQGSERFRPEILTDATAQDIADIFDNPGMKA